jgi:type I restriction enzyme S subunit
VKTWPRIKLREVLVLDLNKEQIDASKHYEMVGILSFGRGLFGREPVEAGNTSYKYFLRLKEEHVVMSQLFGWEGALALSSAEFDGRYVSPQFPTFLCVPGRIDRHFLGWVMRQPSFWNDLGSRAKGMGDRRRTLNPEALFESETPLPPLAEQQALVARLDALAEKTRQVEAHLDAAERDAEHLLALRFRDAIADAPTRTMAEVAPAVRRLVKIDIDMRYREVGARSFGKGLFIKPDFDGAEATWQKPVWIKAGDLVLSNIKAWEGAIAIAGKAHEDCIASHRYITCVPDPSVATVGFLTYYLLSDKGMKQVGFASPGTADRNRTLSLTNLGKIEVPMPPLATQQTFDRLQAEVAALKAKHAAIRQANAALLPATLERVFA